MNARPLLAALASLWLFAPLPAQQPPAPAPTDQARQPFVVERYHQRVWYDEHGTGRIELATRIRVQTEAAVQDLGQLEFSYDSSTQRLDVDTVRVLKAGGSVVLVPRSAVQDESAPVAREAPVFSDLRVKIVTVPALRPGDILEYRLTWTIRTPLAPGHFWQSAQFIRRAVVLDQRLTLDVPRAKYVLVRTTGTPQPSIADEGDRRVYAWRYANLTVDITEDGTREGHVAKVPPAVSVTTFRTWEDVGRWYGALEREREVPTAAIRAKADSLVSGRTTFHDSVAALYDYVSQEFRYVSLSFGVGRYQPHAASEVLANQYGDCKDKHTLLAALLRAVGIASAPALLSTEGTVDSTVPSPGQFDHLITFVVGRRDSLWLDATPGVAPFRFLFSGIRGRLALVAPLEGPARLVRTPAEAPFPEFERMTVDGQLSEAGRLTATVSRTVRGDAEVVTRAVVRSLPEDRIALFAQRVASAEGMDGTVSAAHASDPGATRDPMEFSYQVDRTGAVEWTGQRARYRPPLPALFAADDDTIASQDTVVLPQGEQSRRLRLVLPPGVTAELPTPVAIANDFGDFRSTYEMRDRVLLVERVLILKLRRLPPSRGGEWAAFRRAVRDDDAQLATLRRSDAPATPRAGGDIESIFQAGLAAYDHRDLSGSVRLLRQVVTRDPRHAKAWLELGRSYLELGQLDSAGACVRRQIALDPFDRFAYNYLGLVLLRSHRREDAAAAFRQQIQVNPLDWRSHASLGQLAFEDHRDSLAVIELRIAAGIAPNVFALHTNLARAYVAAGQPDAAIAEFDRAIELRPLPDVLNAAAYTLAERGVRLDRAEQYARAALDSAAAPLLGLTLDAAGPSEMSGLTTLAHIWDTLGWVFFQKGDLPAAERYLRAARFLDSGTGTIADHLGQLYQRSGRRAEAIKAYAAALATGDSFPQARGRLAALAGGAARVERLVNEAAHGDVQASRTLRIARATRLNGSGIVELLFAPGPRIEAMRFTSGPDELRTLADGIRAATSSFPVLFPDSTPIRLPMRGLLSCSPASGCSVFLLEARMGLPPSDMMRVPTPE